jgi:hypothetical protein
MLALVIEPEPEHASEGHHRATPGCLGYALAIAVSLVAFALELAVVDAWETGVLDDFLDVVIIVILFGAIPAAVIGSVGAFAVHLLTWRTTSQAWAVGGATIAGLVAGLLVYQEDFGPALLLALAAGVGRLAVVRRATAKGSASSSPDRARPSEQGHTR